MMTTVAGLTKCTEWQKDKEACLAALANGEKGLEVDMLLLQWALHYLADEVITLRYRVTELEDMVND